jgi:hypothetical protein
LTFAEAMMEAEVGDICGSHMPTDDRDKFAAELLHPKVANWRCGFQQCRVANACGLRER